MRRSLLAVLATIVAALPAAAGDLEEEFDRKARRAAPRDGFPVLNDPELVAAAKAKGIDDSEPVIGIFLDGEARAYPISIMGRHELANDTCGDVPIAVSW